MTALEPASAAPTGGARSAAQGIVAALALPLFPASAEEPRRPLPLAGLPQLSRDTRMIYGVGRVDSSGRVSNRDIVRALGRRHGDKLDVVLNLGGIVVLSSPEGLLSMPVKPYIVIPAAARRLHNIETGDHVLLAAAPEYGIVIIHTRQAMRVIQESWMLCRIYLPRRRVAIEDGLLTKGLSYHT